MADRMNGLRMICGLLCLVLLAGNLWSMSSWSEARGVYDDICYLRQAHLFQRFGLGGFDTDISREDDGYLAAKLKEIGYPSWSDLRTAPCHNAMAATGKFVIQYPPGTGLVLAVFPQGHQAVPVYACATVIIFSFALLAIFYARTNYDLLRAAAFGGLAIYLMTNPTKASYSMAPTMVVCALAGWLTARLFAAKEGNIPLTLALGFLLGVAVDFRLPNLFLSAGYLVFFLIAWLRKRNIRSLLQGASFALAWLFGMAPTLIANAINAGSPLATTYGGQDVAPPEFSFAIIRDYAGDPQSLLLALAIVGVITIPRELRTDGGRRVVLLTSANLVVNLGFFLSHPVVTPYYTVPIAMLSLWSLLFAVLTAAPEAVDDTLAGQAANARS